MHLRYQVLKTGLRIGLNLATFQSGVQVVVSVDRIRSAALQCCQAIWKVAEHRALSRGVAI